MVLLLKRVKLPKLKLPEKDTEALIFVLISYLLRYVLTLIMLYSNVSDSSIEFKGETKNVTIVTAITDQKRSVRLVL